jgi:Flp pilus assembly pilin Flp
MASALANGRAFASSVPSRPGARDASGSCVMSVLKRLMADESGAAAIEYGLMATGMALALMDVIENVAVTVKATFMLFGRSPQ